MTKKFKKPLSLLLALLMVIGMLAAVPFTATAEEKSFSVNVRKLTGEVYTIQNVTRETTVAELKTLVAAETAIPASGQRLVFAGKQLEDDKTLGEYNIGKDATLHLIVRTTYTVTWMNGETVLETSAGLSAGDIPSYPGETPTKDPDAQYTYTFSGWTDGENSYGLSDTLPAVSGDVTYTATFTAIPKASPAAPEVSVTGTSRVISEPELDAQSGKYVATVQADMQNAAGDYFVYWIDGNGNIIGSYRTYRFYVFGDITLTPVYASEAQYYTERAKAETASRMAGMQANDGSVTLYGEHSVSSGKGITGHGIIVTTNAADKDTLDVDNCENNFAARTTARTLTGLLEVTAAIGSGADTLWARTYVIDGSGEYHYGSVAEYALSGAGPDAIDETVMLDSAEFSVDQQAETEEINTDEPAAESTLTAIINMIIEIVMQIVSFVKSALAIVK